MGFSFVHTADLHLDAPLKALALRDPELASAVGTATRTALSRLIDLCIAEEVAFLLISGDLWDGTASTRTPRFLKQELLRLKAAGIRCFLIRGNHDAAARQTGELDLPENAHLFGPTPGTVELEAGGVPVALHGMSFLNPHAPESLLPRYPAPRQGAVNIGLMHSSLGGSPDHDPYAPCSLTDLQATGYSYWALGHIHRRAVWAGETTVVMPGIPQARDIGEGGDCSVTLVRVADDLTLTTEARVVAPLRFDYLPLDCAGLTDWSELLQALEAALTAAGAAPREEDHLVLRPRLTGETPLAWRIRRDPDLLTENARAFAAAAGIWIDRLVIAVEPPAGDQGPAAGLPPELTATVLDGLASDPALLQQAAEEMQRLRDLLPPELRDILGTGAEEAEALCRDLLARGAPLLLSALSDTETA